MTEPDDLTDTTGHNDENALSSVVSSGIVFSGMSFAAFVEKAKVGMFLIQDGTMHYLNPAMAAFTGHKPEDLIGRRINQMPLIGGLDKYLNQVSISETGEVKSMSFPSQVQHRDGHVVDVELHGTAVEYRGQHAVFGVAVDVSERLLREQELRQSREQLRDLAAHINTVREKQRLLIAREVHDVFGGMLTSIKMDAKRILRRAESSEMIEITEGLIDLVQETIDAAREICEQLHPWLLEHMGLQVALEKQLLLYGKRNNVVCTLVPATGEIQLSRKQAITAYRIFQEALTNISRHAAATEIEVRLVTEKDRFEMHIVDNGRGIEHDSVRDTAMGILGMKERAREAGGSLVVESPPSGGTQLHLILNFAHDEMRDD